MLRNFRAVFKGNQMPMTVVMVVVTLGMVAYLAPSSGHPDAPDNIMARVYGRDILNRDLGQLMGNMMQRMSKEQLQNREAMMPYIQAQALQQMLSMKLMEELAERHSIVVTDEEVKNSLEAQLHQYSIFVDKDGQLKPTSEINAILNDNGLSLKQMEKEVRTNLSGQKLQEQAASLVPVDEKWLELENRLRNEKISFESVALSTDPNAVTDPGDAKLGEMLKASGARFQVGSRRVIQYVYVDKNTFTDIKVDDATVKNAYEAKKSQYIELKASHILFKAQTEEEYAAAKDIALALRAKLEKGLDFAKAATEQSQDPSAKGNHGDLGWFKTGAMVKPFEDAAMAMAPGELSQPVRSPFGIHLIKLEGRREKSFDDAKEELRTQLFQERFATRAKDKLEQLRKRAGERGDLGPGARNLGLKVQVSKPFLDEPGSALEGLPEASMILSSAFRMKVGDVSKTQRAGEGFVVFRVQEERPSTIPSLSEIRSKVLEAWKLEEARRACFEKAKGILAGGNDLSGLGTVEKKDSVTLQSLDELGQHEAIRKALLDTPVGQTTPLLWNTDGKLWVARITDRKPAEPLTFETRQKLVRQIQDMTAAKMLRAEKEDLYTKGEKRSGFSSLWGRFGGIWINEEAMRRGKTEALDVE
jgi:peptidyl-prolyl cis-trans isomerase D